jgi:hypothetical protein
MRDMSYEFVYEMSCFFEMFCALTVIVIGVLFLRPCFAAFFPNEISSFLAVTICCPYELLCLLQRNFCTRYLDAM